MLRCSSSNCFLRSCARTLAFSTSSSFDLEMKSSAPLVRASIIACRFSAAVNMSSGMSRCNEEALMRRQV